MAYVPIANIVFQYDEQDNWWLKFYIPSTTTPIAMATDNTGSTLLAKCKLDQDGFPTTDGTSIFIPHLDQNYDAWIFPTEAQADANDTASAIRVAECINPFNDDFSASRNVLVGVTGQTTYPLEFNVSGEAVVIVNGEVLTEGSPPEGDYTLTPNGTFYDLNLTNSVFDGDKIQVWSRIIAPAKAPLDPSNTALKFISDIALTDLSGVDNFATQNYDTVGDNGGAEWSYTGETVPAKAGVPPELATGNVYDINGRKFIYSKTVVFDRAFGVKSSKQNANIHIDVTQQLNDMIAFARLRSAQDGLPKGGSNLFFTSRSEYEKTGTLDLIDFYITIDFNNCEFWQQDTSDVFNWEANGAGFKNVFLEYADSVTDEDFYNDKPAFVRISGNQPIDVRSESVFSKISNVWARRGWDFFRIDAQVPFGGLFWQMMFERCYVREHLNLAYNFVTISQVATTSAGYNCHVGAKTRSGVSNNGESYLALQHMEPSSPVEPGVTPGWEDFWEKEGTPILTRQQWQAGVFYKTMGKGWYINNVQTMDLNTCSMDGGHNNENGWVINTFNSVTNIVGTFHLEGHTLSKADGISMLWGSDGVIDNLYMFDLRLRPEDGNKAYLFGGVAGRNRNIHLENIRNQNQAIITSGTLSYLDGGNDITAFNAISCGSGVPVHLTDNVPDESHFDRPIKTVILTATGTPGTATYSKGVKTYVITSGTGASPEYTVQREDSEAIIQADADVGVMTVNFPTSVVPQGDSIKIVCRGTSTVAWTTDGTQEGQTTGASQKVITVHKMTETVFLGEVSA